MSRRRPDQPPPDRLAALLGVAVSGASTAEGAGGWVPARDDVELIAPPRRALRKPLRPQGPSARGGVWDSSGSNPRSRAAATSTATPPGGRASREGPDRRGRLDGGDGRHRRPAPPRPRLLTVPVSLRGASVRPRRTAVLGLLLVLVLVTGVLAVRLFVARASAPPEPVPVPAAAHGPPAGLQSRSVPAAFATGSESSAVAAAGAPAARGTATAPAGRAPAASLAVAGPAGT